MRFLERKKSSRFSDYVFGSSTMFQRRKEWICESRCQQVSVPLLIICAIFLPLNPSTTTVYAQSAFYPRLRFSLSLQSAVCSLHFTPGPQSAVRSPQSTSYTDRINNEFGAKFLDASFTITLTMSSVDSILLLRSLRVL